MAVTRRWYASKTTLTTTAVLLFIVEVYANAVLEGTVRYLVIGVCILAMLACLWRLSVIKRAETSGSE